MHARHHLGAIGGLEGLGDGEETNSGVGQEDGELGSEGGEVGGRGADPEEGDEVEGEIVEFVFG